MNKFRLISAALFITALFAISAFAQTAAPAAQGIAKIVVIDTGAFGGDEKGAGGITKFVTASKALDTEFASVTADLQATATRITNLQKEIQTIQDQDAKGVPYDKTAAQAKIEQYQNLQTEYKRKQEDGKAKFDRRQAQVLGPVMQDIYKALQDFTKQKGYGMILDAAKLDAQQMILGYDDAKMDVTKEFITFYNARPATASTATPK